MLYGHLIAYKEFVYSGDLFYENGSLLPFSIVHALRREGFFISERVRLGAPFAQLIEKVFYRRTAAE
ncbi:hypothetical protein [Agathobaculum desmolans]|uniref:hypothetical protein n=1 Tax=Agathobaculum desmolans TaxID=39484 RepID=UPI00248D6217|nr:hypothetical protein [Agathobaculum desmolans]